MITYKNILEIFQNIADNHYLINSFHSGLLDEVDINKLDGKDYPILYVEPSTTNVDKGVLTYNFNVYVMSTINNKDLAVGSHSATTGKFTFNDTSNREQVWSDMLQVMKDIISEFKQNQSIQTSGDDSGKKISYVPDEIVLDIPVNIEPFTVRFANMLTGWTSTFSMQVNNDNTLCDIPIDPSDNLPNT